MEAVTWGLGLYAEGAEGSAGPANPPDRESTMAALSRSFSQPDGQADTPQDGVVTTLEQLLALPEGAAFLIADGQIGRTRWSDVRSIAVQNLNGGMSGMAPERIPLPVRIIWLPPAAN